MAHTREIIDSNPRFIISSQTRGVTAQQSGLKLIQGDHNSERLTFEVPRFVEGHDMSECSKIEVHFNNISADKKNESRDVYKVDDVQLDADTESTLTFSWLISGNATKYAGILSFLIKFTCLTGETTDYVWNTDLYSDITVGEGMDNGEAVIAEYSDVLEAWKTSILGELAGAITVDAELSETSENPVQNKVVNAAIANLQAQIDLHHPVQEYISMMPYLQSNDVANINLLLQKGKKFHFNGCYRPAEVVDTIDYDYELAEIFGCIVFDWEWTPDATPSYNGTPCTGAVSNFTASLDYEGYTLVSASATRMTASFNSYDAGDDYGVIIEIGCSLDLSVTIKDSDGTEYTTDYGYLWWCWVVEGDYMGPTDGCMNYMESFIEKSDETAHFFPSTLDFRTQSIDRRLAAALEEAIAKRRAEQNNETT